MPEKRTARVENVSPSRRFVGEVSLDAARDWFLDVARDVARDEKAEVPADVGPERVCCSSSSASSSPGSASMSIPSPLSALLSATCRAYSLAASSRIMYSSWRSLVASGSSSSSPDESPSIAACVSARWSCRSAKLVTRRIVLSLFPRGRLQPPKKPRSVVSDAGLWVDFIVVMLSPLGRRVSVPGDALPIAGVGGRLVKGVLGAEWKRVSTDSEETLREGVWDVVGDGSGDG